MLRKMIAVSLIAAILSAVPLTKSYAGEKEWATAGKILAGAVGFAILNELLSDDHHDARRVYVGRPIYHVKTSAPRRYWMPGRYVEVVEKEWIPGYFEKVWVPPRYERVWVSYGRHGRSGHWEERLVSKGYYERIWHKGYYEYRTVRKWIPGHWEYS